MAYAVTHLPIKRRHGLRGLGDSISSPCIPDNGNYSMTGSGHHASGPPYYGSACTYIAPPQSAPAAPAANVTVNTAVSPQISPVFQQQYQPSNSPLSAGTTQTSPTQGGQTGISSSDLANLLAQEAAAQQAQAAQQAELQAALSAQSAAQQAAAVTAAQSAGAASVPSSSSTANLMPLDSISQLPQADQGASTAIVAATPIVAAPTTYNNTMLILMALGTLAAFMALQPSHKGKSHGIRS